MSENWNLTSFLGQKNIKDLVSLFGSETPYIKQQYLHFNFKNKQSSSTDEGGYIYNIYDTQKNIAPDGGIFIENKNNIISMRISPIYIKGIDPVDARKWRESRAKLLFVLIDELKHDSIILNSTHRFHFILKARVDNRSFEEFNYTNSKNTLINQCDLIFYPTNDGVYHFNTPINFPDTITIKFIPNYIDNNLKLPIINKKSRFEVIVDGFNNNTYLQRRLFIAGTDSYFNVDIEYINKKFPHKQPSKFFDTDTIENIAFIRGEYTIVSVRRYTWDSVLEYTYTNAEIDELNETFTPVYFSPLYLINVLSGSFTYPGTFTSILSIRTHPIIIPNPVSPFRDYIIILEPKEYATFDFTIKTTHLI